MKRLSLSLLAKQIVDTRKLKNMTPKELSELTGINRGMIVRIEAKDYIPSILQLEKTGEVLEFEPISFFVDTEESTPLEKHVPLNISVAGTVQEKILSQTVY
ncbi:MAG: helix-turn-helix transcriptional regulator [Anaerostipes sp.]|nr:helix-turn-helix transcriptional regulator [Anaerostipes sp.]